MSVKKLSPANQISAKMQICHIVGQLELDEISSRPSSSSVSNYDVQTPRPTPTLFPTSQTSPASLPEVPDYDLQYMTNTSGQNFI